MGSGKDPIANLVAAVADGTPVDWDRIEHDATPAQRGFIEQLRLIATLFDSHKSLATPESDHPKSAARYSPGARAERRAGDLGRWGDVVLIEEVGRGSYGAVYRAHDSRLCRPVAAKLLPQNSSAADAQLESKLLHEGRTLARVQHPGVVKVYRADKHN